MRYLFTWRLVVMLLFAVVVNLQGQTAGIAPAQVDFDTKQRSVANMASTYVPLDSWVYYALSRLEALGYVQTGFAGLRPWTRMECARLVAEAEERAVNDDSGSEAEGLYRSLSQEFAVELRRVDGAANIGLQIESIYTQVLGISGRPLADGYHFAQTLTNNFGRPYGKGANFYAGGAVRGVAGPLALYLRGEYQHSGSLPPLSPAAESAIAQADFTPSASAGPVSNVSRFRILDAY